MASRSSIAWVSPPGCPCYEGFYFEVGVSPLHLQAIPVKSQNSNGGDSTKGLAGDPSGVVHFEVVDRVCLRIVAQRIEQERPFRGQVGGRCRILPSTGNCEPL